MARGKKTGGRDFLPGNSGNPNGGPPTPDVREARKANKEQLTLILTKQLVMTRSELQALAANKDTPSMELLVASILSRAINTGDYSRATFLFDRAFGKVTDKIGFDGSVHAALVAAMRGIGAS